LEFNEVLFKEVWRRLGGLALRKRAAIKNKPL
jgi:hypothetical protein